MNASKRLLIIGAIVIAVSAAIQVALPALIYRSIDSTTPGGQDFLLALELVLRFLAGVLPPLGAAIFGAGLVVLVLEGSGNVSFRGRGGRRNGIRRRMNGHRPDDTREHGDPNGPAA